jgi:hypothetical protein
MTQVHKLDQYTNDRQTRWTMSPKVCMKFYDRTRTEAFGATHKVTAPRRRKLQRPSRNEGACGHKGAPSPPPLIQHGASARAAVAACTDESLENT